MSFLAPFINGGLTQFLWMVFGFLVVLTVLVFVHELGHYLIAQYLTKEPIGRDDPRQTRPARAPLSLMRGLPKAIPRWRPCIGR